MITNKIIITLNYSKSSGISDKKIKAVKERIFENRADKDEVTFRFEVRGNYNLESVIGVTFQGRKYKIKSINDAINTHHYIIETKEAFIGLADFDKLYSIGYLRSVYEEGVNKDIFDILMTGKCKLFDEQTVAVHRNNELYNQVMRRVMSVALDPMPTLEDTLVICTENKHYKVTNISQEEDDNLVVYETELIRWAS